MSSPRRRSCFVPPYLLRSLADRRPDAAARWQGTLAEDGRMRAARGSVEPVVVPAAEPEAGAPAWVMHDAGGGTALPGDVVRTAGEPAVGDDAVDEAATGVAGSLALFAEVYDRRSYDDAGATVSASVHYGRDYVNAFWDGTQLVFGDGDGEVFDRFTKPVDVLGHEFTHAVTERAAGLVYQDQPGALNESVSDAFAACLKQRLRGQSPDEADWVIGEGLFLPGVNARGLRDMRAPGTAYDDPALGRDPQPAHLRDYVETTDDNGGVHLNSGIPNRAFHLAAVALGGSSWEGAGRVWYAALTGGDVLPRTDFAGFAAATIAAAERLDGVDPGLVGQAWAEVGVAPDAGSVAPGGDAPTRVVVRRSGGFAGLTTSGEVDLAAAGADERAREVRDLLARIDVRGLRTGAPQPDRYVYDVEIDGQHVTVQEQDLTDDLRRVADLVLGAGGSSA